MIPITSSAITTCREGFEALARLHHLLKEEQSEDIQIDCSHLTWIDAQLGAALLIVVKHAFNNGKKVSLKNLRLNVRSILSKNKTLRIQTDDIYKTTIPVEVFETFDEKIFADYTRRNLTRPEMPSMGQTLTRKFYEGIDELFSNASLHSKSKKIVCAGQFYPKQEKITFLIADGGIGIHNSATAAGQSFQTDADAIDWAMTHGSTSRRGDMPGGLGLKILRSFINLNGGNIKIASHEGYWEEENGITVKRKLRAQFPGTVVSMTVQTNDKNSYDLAPTSTTGIW